MPSPARLLLAAALLLPAAAPAGFEDSIRCEGGLVSVGDSKLDLLGRCGAPTLREAKEVERSSSRRDDGNGVSERSASTVTVERWTYDFGPRRFLGHVTLELGVVTSVSHGGYGYRPAGPGDQAPGIPRARCGMLAFRVGEAAYDLLARCGEPALREVEVVTRTVRRASGPGTLEATSVSRQVERWTYDLGPRSLVQLVTVDDGRVTRVGAGGYGYSRDEPR
ncbi:MAG: DUF2845 domain-containing protein [Anaeromyxobacteraceae bacterium]|nr:DUF2845 domain-containing protein [Anaeromyxobacteraceae bacterium]